jgi:hypothetical protein
VWNWGGNIDLRKGQGERKKRGRFFLLFYPKVALTSPAPSHRAQALLRHCSEVDQEMIIYQVSMSKT